MPLKLVIARRNATSLPLIITPGKLKHEAMKKASLNRKEAKSAMI
jgi:hypothetical protein